MRVGVDHRRGFTSLGLTPVDDASETQRFGVIDLEARGNLQPPARRPVDLCGEGSLLSDLPNLRRNFRLQLAEEHFNI